MTVTEAVARFGITRQRISRLILELGLVEGEDYIRKRTKNQLLRIHLLPTGIDKIANRNTDHFSEKSGRPRKHPKKKPSGLTRGRPKKVKV